MLTQNNKAQCPLLFTDLLEIIMENLDLYYLLNNEGKVLSQCLGGKAGFGTKDCES